MSDEETEDITEYTEEEINRSSVINNINMNPINHGNMQVGDYNQITYYPDNGCSKHENNCVECPVSNEETEDIPDYTEEEINRSSVINNINMNPINHGNMQVGDYNQITYYPDNGCFIHENTCLKCSVSNVSLNINDLQDGMNAGKVENRDNHSQLMGRFGQLSIGMDGLYSRLDDLNRRINILSRRPNEVEKIITFIPQSDDNAAERMVTSNTQSADNTAVKSVTWSTQSDDNAAERRVTLIPQSDDNAVERMVTLNTRSDDNTAVKSVTLIPQSDDNAVERMVTLNTLSADNTAVKSVTWSTQSDDNAAERRVIKNDHTYIIDNMDRQLECVNRTIDQMDDRLTNAEELVRLKSGNDANRMPNMETRPLDEGSRIARNISQMNDAINGRLDAFGVGIWQINARLDNVTDHFKLISQTVAAMSVDYEYPKIKIKRSKWKRIKQLFRRKSKKNNDDYMYAICSEDHIENLIDNNLVDDDVYAICSEDHSENHIDNNLVDDDIYVNFPEDHSENHIDNNLVDDNVNAIDSEDHTGNHIDNNLVDDDVYAIDSEGHAENNGASIGCSTTNSERPVIEERYSTLSSHGIGNNDDSYLEINSTSDENGGYINSNEDTVIRPLPDLPPSIASTVENSHLLYDKHTRFHYIYGNSDVLY